MIASLPKTIPHLFAMPKHPPDAIHLPHTLFAWSFPLCYLCNPPYPHYPIHSLFTLPVHSIEGLQKLHNSGRFTHPSHLPPSIPDYASLNQSILSPKESIIKLYSVTSVTFVTFFISVQSALFSGFDGVKTPVQEVTKGHKGYKLHHTAPPRSQLPLIIAIDGRPTLSHSTSSDRSCDTVTHPRAEGMLASVDHHRATYTCVHICWFFAEFLGSLHSPLIRSTSPMAYPVAHIVAPLLMPPPLSNLAVLPLLPCCLTPLFSPSLVRCCTIRSRVTKVTRFHPSDPLLFFLASLHI
jgi:hypothetical protein